MSVSNASNVSGAKEPPLRSQTVDAALRDAARQWPHRPALICRHQQRRYTYAELDAEVDRVARGFVQLGLRPQERIGIWCPNNAEWILTLFAASRAGLILVNINPAYRLTELEFALRQVGARALVLSPAFKSSDYIGMMAELLPEIAGSRRGALRAAQLPELRLLIQIGGGETAGYFSFADIVVLGDAVKTQPAAEHARNEDPHLPYNIQFTSGTTGLPKGVTLTHFNLINNGFFVGEGMRLTEQDSVCVPVPLYHCFGMVLGVLAAITHGSALVFPNDGFDAERVLEAVVAERCTALYGVPTMFIAELEHPRFREFDLTSLRTGIMAGAPCPVAIMRRVVEEMHMREVTICYGMTETSPVSFQTGPFDPLEKRVGSVGRIHPHVEVKIVDSDGRTVPRGNSGELCTRGYSVMQGYWGEPERTREVIDGEGWMHTGDLAVLDDEGYCNIVGRLKDMIIRGGENVSPREIEEFLYRHPAVLDVAVVGVPDRTFGEEICACIRLKESANATDEDIREFCRGRIAHYKVPRYVRFVSCYPLTVTGKVQKYLLREQMRVELGLSAEKCA